MRKVMESIKLYELARKINCEPVGENVDIRNVSGVDDAGEGKITWAESRKALDKALGSSASAVIISDKLYKEAGELLKIPLIIAPNPRFAFAQTLEIFYERLLPPPGIAPTAVIGKNVTIGQNVHIGDFVILGDNSEIGDNSTIFPHVYLGHGVKIGSGSVIYPFASVYNRCIVGNNVIIHSGSVIGADGFGFVAVGGVQKKVAQVGIVEIKDNVEIGANVTIDRATTGATVIGEGSKIDNLVQIGHNCRLGKNCIMVSQSGIAGSCVFGDNVTLAAQAGLAPHITIGSNTTIGGRSGVNHNIPENSVVSGFPAKPHKEALRIQAMTQRLPSTMQTIREMEKRIEELEKKLEELLSSNVR